MRLVIAIACSLSLAVLPVRADDKPSEEVVKVIKKAIEAHGGEANLNKFPAGTIKFKAAMSLGGLDLELNGDMAYSLPSKHKTVMTGEVMGQKLTIVQTFDGKNGKMLVNGAEQPLPDKVKDEMAMTVISQEITQFTPLLDPSKFTLKAGGPSDVNGKKATVVIVTPKALKDKEIKLFFDNADGLLLKTQRKAVGSDGSSDVDEETENLDYKAVQGIKMPFKAIVKHDGAKFMTMTVTEAKLFEKLDPKLLSQDD